jgi:hypothetical protein
MLEWAPGDVNNHGEWGGNQSLLALGGWSPVRHDGDSTVAGILPLRRRDRLEHEAVARHGGWEMLAALQRCRLGARMGLPGPTAQIVRFCHWEGAIAYSRCDER